MLIWIFGKLRMFFCSISLLMMAKSSNYFRRLLAYLWASPCTLLGLTFALSALVLGASWRKTHGNLEISLAPERRWLKKNIRLRLIQRLPFSAITFGHVIIGKNRKTLDYLRAHEQVHVRQYEHWGALFLVAYPASSLLQWLIGKQPYWDNHFERQARRYDELNHALHAGKTPVDK